MGKESGVTARRRSVIEFLEDTPAASPGGELSAA